MIPLFKSQNKGVIVKSLYYRFLLMGGRFWLEVTMAIVKGGELVYTNYSPNKFVYTSLK